MRGISLGLGARELRDADMFSKSDPFCVISRPSLEGGFNQIRVSETKKNTLNPDWSDFFFKEDEVPNSDLTLNLRIQIFDDDGKKGLDKHDKLLGQGSFSLKQLEAANMVNTTLPLYDGKRQKPAGKLVVRSFKIHATEDPAPPQPAQYPTKGTGNAGLVPNMPGQYIHPHGAGYPPNTGGYPPSSAGYPANTSVYLPTTGGYPPSTTGYPPIAGGYPPAGSGYPPVGSGYPPPGSGYPPAAPGYPPGAPGNPPAAQGYPPAGYPPSGGLPYPTTPGYPTAGFTMPGSLFPQDNLPKGPGYQ